MNSDLINCYDSYDELISMKAHDEIFDTLCKDPEVLITFLVSEPSFLKQWCAEHAQLELDDWGYSDRVASICEHCRLFTEQEVKRIFDLVVATCLESDNQDNARLMFGYMIYYFHTEEQRADIVLNLLHKAKEERNVHIWSLIGELFGNRLYGSTYLARPLELSYGSKCIDVCSEIIEAGYDHEQIGYAVKLWRDWFQSVEYTITYASLNEYTNPEGCSEAAFYLSPEFYPNLTRLITLTRYLLERSWCANEFSIKSDIYIWFSHMINILPDTLFESLSRELIVAMAAKDFVSIGKVWLEEKNNESLLTLKTILWLICQWFDDLEDVYFDCFITGLYTVLDFSEQERQELTIGQTIFEFDLTPFPIEEYHWLDESIEQTRAQAKLLVCTNADILYSYFQKCIHVSPMYVYLLSGLFPSKQMNNEIAVQRWQDFIQENSGYIKSLLSDNDLFTLSMAFSLVSVDKSWQTCSQDIVNATKLATQQENVFLLVGILSTLEQRENDINDEMSIQTGDLYHDIIKKLMLILINNHHLRCKRSFVKSVLTSVSKKAYEKVPSLRVFITTFETEELQWKLNTDYQIYYEVDINFIMERTPMHMFARDALSLLEVGDNMMKSMMTNGAHVRSIAKYSSILLAFLKHYPQWIQLNPYKNDLYNCLIWAFGILQEGYEDNFIRNRRFSNTTWSDNMSCCLCICLKTITPSQSILNQIQDIFLQRFCGESSSDMLFINKLATNAGPLSPLMNEYAQDIILLTIKDEFLALSQKSRAVAHNVSKVFISLFKLHERKCFEYLKNWGVLEFVVKMLPLDPSKTIDLITAVSSFYKLNEKGLSEEFFIYRSDAGGPLTSDVEEAEAELELQIKVSEQFSSFQSTLLNMLISEYESCASQQSLQTAQKMPESQINSLCIYDQRVIRKLQIIGNLFQQIQHTEAFKETRFHI